MGNKVAQVAVLRKKKGSEMALEYGLRVFLSKGGCEMGHEWGTQNHLLKMKIASGVTLKRLSSDPLGDRKGFEIRLKVLPGR